MKHDNDETGMITIPVTVNYNGNPIGTMQIDKRYLPKGTGYLFAVGGICKKGAMEWNEQLGRKVWVVSDFELTEVSLIPENRYDWTNIEFDDISAVPQPVKLPNPPETEAVTKTI